MTLLILKNGTTGGTDGEVLSEHPSELNPTYAPIGRLADVAAVQESPSERLHVRAEVASGFYENVQVTPVNENADHWALAEEVGGVAGAFTYEGTVTLGTVAGVNVPFHRKAKYTPGEALGPHRESHLWIRGDWNTGVPPLPAAESGWFLYQTGLTVPAGFGGGPVHLPGVCYNGVFYIQSGVKTLTYDIAAQSLSLLGSTAQTIPDLRGDPFYPTPAVARSGDLLYYTATCVQGPLPDLHWVGVFFSYDTTSDLWTVISVQELADYPGTGLETLFPGSGGTVEDIVPSAWIYENVYYTVGGWRGTQTSEHNPSYRGWRVSLAGTWQRFDLPFRFVPGPFIQENEKITFFGSGRYDITTWAYTFNEIWEYDCVADTWTLRGTLHTPSIMDWGSAALLDNGYAYVISRLPQALTERYDPAAHTIENDTFSTYPHYGHTTWIASHDRPSGVFTGVHADPQGTWFAMSESAGVLSVYVYRYPT